MASSAADAVPFSSPEFAGAYTRAFLFASLAWSAVAAVSGTLQLALLLRALHGGISAAEATANDDRQQLIGVIQLVLIVATATAFLVWFHRVRRNLPSLGGRELRYSQGWAVGGFFVPLLNFVRPFQVMREVWHGSDPAGLERDATAGGPALRNQLPAPQLVAGWWALFIISNLIGNTAGRILRNAGGNIDVLQGATVLLVFSDLLEIPSALVTIRLVGQVTRSQIRRAELLGIRPALDPGGTVGARA